MSARSSRITLVLAFAIGTNLASATPPASAAPPPNDDILNATVVDELRFDDSVDIDLATEADDDPRCFGRNTHTVWYSFTPSQDMRIDARASAGEDPNNPRTLSAYVGAPGSLDKVGCGLSDNGNGFPARIGVHASGGEQLFFMIGIDGRRVSDTSVVAFSLRRGRLPPNDDFDDAIAIDSLPFQDRADTFWATPDPDDPPDTPGCAEVPDHSIWYRYTATENVRIAVKTVLPGVVLAYAGRRRALTPRGCDMEFGDPVELNVAAGDTVHFVVDWLGLVGPVAAEAIPLEEAPNDDLGSATAVGRLPFSETVDVSGATSQPRDPDCLGANGTVWYAFTPRFDTLLEATTQGSAYDTVLAAFELKRGVLRAIACRNDDLPPVPLPFPPGPDSGSGFPTERLRFRALADHTYYFMVGALEPPSILEFSLEEHVPVHVSGGAATAEGAADIIVSVKCSHRLDGQLFLEASQRLAPDRFATGSVLESRGCRGGEESFVITLRPDRPRQDFHSGRMRVDLDWSFFDRRGSLYARTALTDIVHLEAG